MSKQEVSALSDEALGKEYNMVKAIIKSSLPPTLGYMDSNMLFVHWLNVSAEVDYREKKAK